MLTDRIVMQIGTSLFKMETKTFRKIRLILFNKENKANSILSSPSANLWHKHDNFISLDIQCQKIRDEEMDKF